MKYRHLNIFKTVCELGNMTQAAQKLHMSQPSVSQVIKELEGYYQVILFERYGRRLYITEDGTRLLKYAKRIVDLFDEVEEGFLNAGKKIIRVGTTVTIGTYLLGPWLSDFDNKDAIRSSMHNTKLLEDRLLMAELDLGLVEGHVDSQDLIVKPFMKDELVVIASKENQLAMNKNILPGRLEGQGIFIREEGSGSRRIFLDWLKSNKLKMKTMGEMTSNEAIVHAVANDLGLGVVSRAALKDHKDILVLDLACESMYRDFSVVYHKDKTINGDLQTFIDHIVNLGRTVQ